MRLKSVDELKRVMIDAGIAENANQKKSNCPLFAEVELRRVPWRQLW
jgi:hypothetical protein